MRVVLNDGGEYQLDQEEAINDLLREHGLSNANLTLAPIGSDCYEIHPSDNALLEGKGKNGLPTVKEFQSLVGSLLWVARCTLPDIVFAVHKATRQTHQPLLHDQKLAERVARYLTGTKSMKLNLTPSENDGMSIVVKNYSDADFAADKSDRKSLTGGSVLLNGMAVSWCAKKQGGVMLSTMEAEFVAALEVARERLGIRKTYANSVQWQNCPCYCMSTIKLLLDSLKEKRRRSRPSILTFEPSLFAILPDWDCADTVRAIVGKAGRFADQGTRRAMLAKLRALMRVGQDGKS
uniref:LAGLIDADG endonuclease n=1 Tax=Peronospora matthiolae TaxID=2874970 RepID=A0AAV1VGV3_9STRA